MSPRKGETREQYLERRRLSERVNYARQVGNVDDRLELMAQLKGLEAGTRELEAEIRELEIEIRRRDEEAEELRLRNSMKFTPLVIPFEEHLPGAPGMPMTLWSDWHWGEEVDIRETGGLNEFNKRIAVQRVSNLVWNTVSLLRNYAGLRPEFPGIWVLLGGDMVSGLIHDELVETNWGNIVIQSIEVAGAIAGALENLADEFCGPVERWGEGMPQIGVAGVVGNHGRTTRKPRAKGKATDSYDRAVYHSVAAHFANDPRFSFVIPDDTDYLISVYGHRFLLTHGDSLGTKGGDGIIGPIGPIMRGTIKIRNSEAVVGRDFDTLVVGHWHCDQPRGTLFPVIVNGTLKGFDEYARVVLRAKFARPSQQLWLVSPKYGIAAQWPVYVD